jgi:hypothetical protein
VDETHSTHQFTSVVGTTNVLPELEIYRWNVLDLSNSARFVLFQVSSLPLCDFKSLNLSSFLLPCHQSNPAGSNGPFLELPRHHLRLPVQYHSEKYFTQPYRFFLTRKSTLSGSMDQLLTLRHFVPSLLLPGNDLDHLCPPAEHDRQAQRRM